MKAQRLQGRVLALVMALGLGWLPLNLQGAESWPTLRGNSARTGYVAGKLAGQYRLAWAAEFAGERLGTAMEPIVSAGLVFVGTHQGGLYALDAGTGELKWSRRVDGPVLHSPACASGLVLAGTEAGFLHAWKESDGGVVWSRWIDAGGFAASPCVTGDRLVIGSRAGKVVAVEVTSGTILWQHELQVPVRQTSAAAGGVVMLVGEDLRARCFESATGRLVWTSAPMQGQSARDYYPVLAEAGQGLRAMVRTMPAVNMAERIAEDRGVICRNAGIDDRTWRELDAYVKSDRTRGDPDKWAAESVAIRRHLANAPEARTAFLWEAASGESPSQPPVLWLGGCQSVGVPPVWLGDGRFLVFHRTAYGNWNHGVAPLVGLGVWEPAADRVVPLFHRQGPQPPWNTFWGTADESQNFVVVGREVLIVHQGTLSRYDLDSGSLRTVLGERDTFGGFPNPAWARNEWHGPARGGVAVTSQGIFWLTGSRVLALQPGQGQGRVAPRRVDPAVKGPGVERAALLPLPETRARLAQLTEEVIETDWAPLYVEPGLAGREFFFADSGDYVLALAWAWPHLPASLQQRVSERMRQLWRSHPLWSEQCRLPLNQGRRREWFRVPEGKLSRVGQDRPPHPFGNAYAAWFCGERVGMADLVAASWPEWRRAYEAFSGTGWRLNSEKPDRYANRYVGSLLAFERMARAAGEISLAERAAAEARSGIEALTAWWQHVARTGTLGTFEGAAQLDAFIGSGDGLSTALAPHRHKVALLMDLTPEVAARLRSAASHEVEAVWGQFERLYATWWLVGEERQVHCGENAFDPPDLAIGALEGLAWLRQAGAPQLGGRLDLAWGRADLFHLRKLALLLEAAGAEEADRSATR